MCSIYFLRQRPETERKNMDVASQNVTFFDRRTSNTNRSRTVDLT